MTTLAVQAQSVILISVVKPIAMTVVLFGWARAVLFLDKDIQTIGGSPRLWNTAQVLAGVCAFGIWLVMPDFLIGLLVMVLICGSGIAGYAYYRNHLVSAEARWNWHKLLTFQGLNPLVPRWLKNATPVKLAGPDGITLPSPSGQDPHAWVNRVFERLMGYALGKQTQRMVIHTNAKETQLVLQIDGITYPQPPIHPTTTTQIMDYVKHRAGIDPAERRRRLVGRLWVNAGSKHHALVVTTLGTMRGLELVIDVDPHLCTKRTLDTLGLLPHQQQQLEHALGQDHGVVLVSCPPGQGQTTILYSMIKRHDPYTQSVLTLEDRVAMEMEGVNHNQVQAGPGAPTMLRQAQKLLHQQPQVLMFSDLIDHQVYKLLAPAAQEETRVYLGMRQPDTFAALKHWAQQVGDPTKAIEALRVVVVGYLVRRLCETCRVPYTPHTSLLKKLNLSASSIGEFYKDAAQAGTDAKACSDCGGIGYKGRVGLFEVMAFDDEVKRLILSDQLEPLRVYLRKQKMTWLSEAALSRVIDGTTTISEITRVLNPSAASRLESGAPARQA